MDEKPGRTSKEVNKNGNREAYSECQSSPWYFQSPEKANLYSPKPSQHRATPVFQSVPTPVTPVPSLCGSISQSILNDRTFDSSSKRPGTPALLQTINPLPGAMQDGKSVNDDLPPYSIRSTVENYALCDSLLSDSRPVDACQPPPLYSFLATALQGNVARSAGLVEQTRTTAANFQNYHGSDHPFQYAEQREYVSNPLQHSYQFYQVQNLQSDGVSNIRPVFNNHNFNNLHHNMVRLKSGENSDDKNSESDIPNGGQYVEDDEGNHECHDLRHALRQQECNGDLEHPAGTSASIIIPEPLTSTPEVGNGELNRFAALGASIYQGEWPLNRALWMSGPSSIGEKDSLSGLVGDDTESIMSFSSSTAAGTRHSHSHQLGTKVEMVYSLLSMLGSSNKDDMSKTLLEMSNNRESCIAMRQSGCLPLLVQLLHGTDHEYILSEQDPNSLRWALREARRRAGQALHNIVYAHPDDKRGRREARVLRLLEQIRDYSDYLKDVRRGSPDVAQNENLELHPGPAIAALMKLSFDEEHRHAMCLLGGLQAIAELIQADHEVHGNTNDQFCITVRRYAGMALTNLTFGDGTNKALLCSMKPFMQALVAQLHSPNEDLRQVTASVLRNLSWRADTASKQILREVGAVVTLMQISMQTSKESTLKSILSALWNLSAHCSVNKADICAIDGALEFLVSTLTYKSSSKTLSIVENGGGILRNISSHIAIKEEYRTTLRKHNCLQTLLRHLKSPSLTVVSNACGTLWNLSARCQQDQQALWEMGAVGMLRNLIHSKHKMISMGSAAALKNLLAARPPGMGLGLSGYMENGHGQNGSQSNSPSLLVRKQRALEADIDQNLSETCDNIDSPKTSPTSSSNKKFTFENNGVKPHYLSYLPGRMYHSINGHVTSPLYVPRSESRDSVGSTHSEPPHYRAQCERFRILVNTNRQLPFDLRTVQEKPSEWKEKTNLELEENTNIVMQLFRSLQDNTNPSENCNISQNMHLPLDIKRYPRANNLTAVKPGTLTVSSREISRTENRNIPLENGIADGENNQNICQTHKNSREISFINGTAQLNTSSQHKYINRFREKRDSSPVYSDVNSFLELPDNKHPLNKEKISYNLQQNSNNFIPLSLNGQAVDSGSTGQSCDQVNNEVFPENSSLNRSHMDTIQENVVLRQKIKSDISHWSSTSTLKEPDSDDTDQTPLAVSRCSSLSSLASCLQQSARSSWMSDISSRRTSGIISPSEIPDSPTSEMKPSVSHFTDKAPDAESLGIPRPRPAWPLGISATSKTFQPISPGYCSPSKFHEEPIKEAIIKRSPHSSEIDDDDDDDKDTISYINVGLPNNSSIALQHNNSKLHSRVNNLSSSFSYIRSGIPIKSNNVRLTQSVPNVSRSAVLSSCATASIASESENTSVNTFESGTSFRRPGQFEVCDDNDNLLFQYQSSSHIQNNVDVQNVLQRNLHYKPIAKQCDKGSAGLESSTVPQFSHGFKKYAPHQNRHKYQANMFRSEYHATENHELPIYDISTSVGNQSSQNNFLQKTYSAIKPSINSENSEGIIQSSQDKRKGKVKTSIPQMVKPWHSNFDSEVHPKQLQIMSQNLPVYKGSFAVHQDVNKENPEITDLGTNAEDSRIISTINQFSDASSPSADSEVSSAELLQECIAAARVSKINRSKAKRNKQSGHSFEIKVSPEHSSDDDKFNASQGQITLDCVTAVHWSEGEEKGKEDERSQEKNREYLLSTSTIPDLLEGAACHADIAAKKGLEGRQIFNVKSNEITKGMSDSTELRKGAFLIAAELEEIADDHTHSSASCFSDLDNIKPPSVMGEMSMTSSGLSDLLSNGNGNGNGKCYMNGKNPVDRRRNLKRIKKANGSHRFVFKSVLQSRDISRSAENSDKPSSITGSIENLSMRSSGTSEILDNINPPSVMDDISMTNSCTSLNSINSDILESRSQSLADPRSDSEMFQRLNAAAAMVQVYSRELSNIMTGSMKSSYNSDNLDQVKPPSVFQDIAEVTVEDGTEVGSDAMISDSELEEELPHDDEGSVPSTETVHSPVHILSKTEPTDGSTENLNSSFETDSICNIEKPYHSAKRISSLALTPQNASIIDMDSNTVQHSIHSLAQSENAMKNTAEELNLIHEDTEQIPFNQSEKDKELNLRISSSVSQRRGPRIVKPINRETIRQMQEKKGNEKQPKSIRGRSSVTSKSVQRAVIRPGVSSKPITSSRKNPLINNVRPTKTSALRASQSQRQTDSKYISGRVSPRSFLSRPPPAKVSSHNSKTHTVSSTKSIVSGTNDCQMSNTQKPAPPVKQGTFTKDEPTQNAPAISPISSNDILDGRMIKSQNDMGVSDLQSTSQEIVSSKSSSSKTIIPVSNHSTKMNSIIKTSVSDSAKVKRSSSNYSIQRNVSLILQKKESSKVMLRPSPSTQNFGAEKDNGKASECNGSKTATYSRNSLSSLSSSSLVLKRTSSQKEATSKISSIWKKSENSSSANSPIADSPVSERLPVAPIAKTKQLAPKTTATNPSMIAAATISQANLPRKSITEKSEKFKFTNVGTSKHQGFVKSPFTGSRSTFVSSSKVGNNLSKKHNVLPKFQNTNLVKVGNTHNNFNEKNDVYNNKSNVITSQTGQRNMQIAQDKSHVHLSDCEAAYKLPQGHNPNLCETDKTMLPENTITSPVSTVVPSFNYAPCANSEQQNEQLPIAVKSEDTEHGDEEESESSKSYSKKGKHIS